MRGDGILEKFRDIINENRTWIIAEEEFLLRVLYIDVGYGMVPYPCDNLILKSVTKSRLYREGHEWYIPEFEIRNSLAKLFPDLPVDQVKRWQVEQVIMDVTGGQLRLNLRDFMSFSM